MNQNRETLTQVRRMTHADLARVLAWRNDPGVRRHMYTQHEITFDEHQRWFERATLDQRKHLFIFELEGQPVGFVHFSEIAPGGVADWGFYTAPDAPKGTGRALGRTALGHAFAEIGLHKVCGEVLVGNPRSMKMHEALGFQREGVLRDQHFDGALYHDVIAFGLLAAEWQT
jgi:UDP-4-amino-4,6-dideoxy-N-acetyl-beta-L-altrosamine N-acetyltransferase